MEEIYIIKLKGLPASSQESLRDNKASFYYRKDLTGEALLGFGLMHVLIGATLMALSVINLLRLELTESSYLTQMGTGLWCGGVFALAGIMAVVTAHKRKTDISKSQIQVKIFFILSLLTLLLALTYLILMTLGIKESAYNQYIASNILMSFIFELFTSLLSLFTCVRVIWPGSLAFCAKDWPMHQKLKRKIIVSTQIYTNGVKQNEDMIRNLGPNCIISLSPPPNGAIIKSSGNHYTTTGDCNECNQTNCEQYCEQCCEVQPNVMDYKFQTPIVALNKCNHNIRTHCLTSDDEEMQSGYDSDSEFDNTVDEYDNENHCHESTHLETRVNVEDSGDNDCSYETENKYESIDTIRTSASAMDQSNQSHKSFQIETSNTDSPTDETNNDGLNANTEKYSTDDKLSQTNGSPKNIQKLDLNCEQNLTEV